MNAEIDVIKTKTITIGDDGYIEPSFVDGIQSEQISQFNFLQSLVTASFGCSAEIRRRLTMAKSDVVGPMGG